MRRKECLGAVEFGCFVGINVDCEPQNDTFLRPSIDSRVALSYFPTMHDQGPQPTTTTAALTTVQFAELEGVHINTVYRWIRSGLLEAKKHWRTKQYEISQDAYDAFKAKEAA